MSQASVPQQDVLREWHRATRLNQTAHLRAAARATRVRHNVGILTTSLSAIVGTAIFATLQSSDLGIVPRVVFGIFSIAASALSAVYALTKEDDQLPQHAAAAQSFGSLRRDIESQLSLPDLGDAEWESYCARFKKEFNKIDKSAPVVRQEIIDESERHLNARTPFP